MEQDPAPALTRGIALLRILERDGRCGLERLAATSGYPKTSVLRLLTSLEAAGAVVRDPATRHYRALLRLAPVEAGGSEVRAAVADRLPELAQRVAATVELYEWTGGDLVLVDRCEPEAQGVHFHAKVGFVRDLSELDALGQVACVWGGRDPDPEAWGYVAGRVRRFSRKRCRELLAAAGSSGVARDNDLNGNGVLRHAVPLLAADDRLLGAVAVARTWLPDPDAADRTIAAALAAVAAEAAPA